MQHNIKIAIGSSDCYYKQNSHNYRKDYFIRRFVLCV